VTLHVIERGIGKPILFVHGWPTNACVWQRQLEALGDAHHVMAVDLPGFGASPPLRQPTIARFASAIREFIDDRALTNVFLIGWSMGGGVVMSYCKRFGAHGLRAIGIVDATPKLLPASDWELGVGTPFTQADIEGWRASWQMDRRAVCADVYGASFRDPSAHSEDIEWILEAALQADPATAITALTDVFNCDFREGLVDIEVPALLLYGAHSSSPEVRAFLEKTIPRATMVVFEESAHLPMLEETESFNRIVGDFAAAVA
jgi:pimeloyl-ACP methyl ester carboxylesterase